MSRLAETLLYRTEHIETLARAAETGDVHY
jgi:hypothetical protein